MGTCLLVGLVLLARLAGAQGSPPACTFGPGALPAETLPPGARHGAQIPLDHIVVLMQENRSFDHYFGRLRQQGQRRAEAEPKRAANPDPTNPRGKPIRAFRQTKTCEVADLDHSWNGTHREWNNGAMDGFTTENAHAKDSTGRRAMGYYTKRELAYYYKLYSNFAIGDRFFCSVLTQTFPNRYYLLAGTSFGHIRNAIPNLSGAEYTQRSVFNLLDEAGVTWRIYFSDLPFGGVFGYVRTQGAANLVPVAQFAADAQAGNLPQVTFVDPRFLGTVNVETDEHPPANVQVGQKFVADVINAVLASPLWPRAAVFLTYDEHGGFYDHVPPPAACLPDDIPPMLQPNDVPGAFDRYGIRVPAVVISPYARKRFVSHRAYDHTSILRFIETRFDLPALTRRDANADPMLELFDFDRPQMLKPPRLPPAVIDEKQRQACEALSAPPNTEP